MASIQDHEPQTPAIMKIGGVALKALTIFAQRSLHQSSQALATTKGVLSTHVMPLIEKQAAMIADAMPRLETWPSYADYGQSSFGSEQSAGGSIRPQAEDATNDTRALSGAAKVEKADGFSLAYPRSSRFAGSLEIDENLARIFGRALPVCLGLYFYATVGTALDTATIFLAGCLLFILYSMPATVSDNRQVVVLVALATVGLALIDLPSGLLFGLIGIVFLVERMSKDMHPIAESACRLVGLMLVVDLGCLLMGLERNVALLAAIALPALLLSHSVHPHFSAMHGFRGRSMIMDGTIVFASVAAYIWLIQSDSTTSGIVLLTVPLYMAGVIRLFYLRHLSDERSTLNNPLLCDGPIRVLVFSWCMLMSSAEVLAPGLA